MDDNYAGGEEVDLQAEVYMVQAISGEREREILPTCYVWTLHVRKIIFSESPPQISVQ